MKKTFKVIVITILSIMILVYLSFLFILPCLNINKYEPIIQKLVKEQTKLDLKYENAKIITTPLLAIGVKADNISVSLPDSTTVFSAEKINTRIALPSLFLLTVKISCLEVEKPYLNLEIINNEQFKVLKLVEDILNSDKEQKLEQRNFAQAQSKSWFNPNWIRIKIVNIKLHNYNILVNDLKNKHYLKLTGEKLKVDYLNGKIAKIKTSATLFSDENKNIIANIDVNTFLPKPAPALDSEDDPAERIEFSFINIVEMYRNYDLKTNLDTKIKLREKNHRIYASGDFNINNLSLKISHIVLPESYAHVKFNGTRLNIDSNINFMPNENLKLSGLINYGVHPNTDLSIKTSDIKFNDILTLSKALLNSLSIPNELARFNASGSISADCNIKTNLKKWQSSGAILINDGSLTVTNIGKIISDADISINLDNNLLDFQNSHLYIDNSRIDINGQINEKSLADITINANKINLAKLFYAFAPQKIRTDFNFKSGELSLEATLQGKLKQAVTSAKIVLTNFDFSDKVQNYIIKNKDFETEFFATTKDFKGNFKNNNLLIFLPKTKSQISLPILEAELYDNNFLLKENKINFNKNSSVKYCGEIHNIKDIESINFDVNGDISTDDIVKFIGVEFKPFLNFHGTLPIKITVDGNKNKQTLFAQILVDKENFITPIDFAELKNKNLSLQTVIDFKGNRTKIKKTGLFEREITVDKKGNEIINLKEVLGIDGTIAGDTINLLKITMPKTLNGTLHIFPNSKFIVNSKIFLFGKLNAPRSRGHIEIKNLSIPELKTDIRNFNLKFRGLVANFEIIDLLLNGSDLQITGNLDLKPDNNINLRKMVVNSRYFNADKVLEIANKAEKYTPKTNSTTVKQNQIADIPVSIHNGNINFTRLISGNIDLRNTISNFAFIKNTLYLNDLKTKVFDGNINGNIAVNILSSLVKINVKGSGLNVEKALLDAANMKDTLSGTADFQTRLSLHGMDLETQMKSLKGYVLFNVKDGQFGPFGKIENMILAENIRESAFFQNCLGGILDGLLTIDTTHFSELNGILDFSDGICHISPITSSGNILSLHILGDFDLLKNTADMKVRARMASLISNLLGPIGAINPANLINSAASLNVVTAKAFSLFCEMVPQSEMDMLPSFSNKYVDNSASKFQIVLKGDVAKPLKLVKSFKWLATETEYKDAENYVETLPEPIEGSPAETIADAIAEQQALDSEMDTTSYKVKSVISKEWANDSVKKEVLKETSSKRKIK